MGNIKCASCFYSEFTPSKYVNSRLVERYKIMCLKRNVEIDKDNGACSEYVICMDCAECDYFEEDSRFEYGNSYGRCLLLKKSVRVDDKNCQNFRQR